MPQKCYDARKRRDRNRKCGKLPPGTVLKDFACLCLDRNSGRLDSRLRSRKDLAADSVRLTSLAAVVTFAGLTALLTYPQVREFATSVLYHSDPYFSMWRLGWVAHSIRNAPGQMFHANIFYPSN